MDPDMVRQQEEAEEEAGRLKRSGPPPIAPAAVISEARLLDDDEEYVEPRPAEPETETGFVHSQAPGLPPILPIRRKKKAAKPAAASGENGTAELIVVKGDL